MFLLIFYVVAKVIHLNVDQMFVLPIDQFGLKLFSINVLKEILNSKKI